MKKIIKRQLQEFQPKDLDRITKTVPETPGLHPTSEDLEKMAKDTIRNAPKFIADKNKQEKAIEDAKKTIADVRKAREKGREK